MEEAVLGTSAGTSAAQTSTGAAPRGISLFILLSQCVSGVDIAMMTVSLASVARQLGALPSEIQWLISASSMTSGGFLILGGRLVDVLGAKRIFIAGTLLCCVGLLPGIFTNFLLPILLCRVLVGLGIAFVNPATLGVIVDLFPVGKARDKAFGIFMIGQSTGFFGGMITGGLIVAFFGWHGAFIFDFIIAACTGMLAFAVLPRDAEANSLSGLDLPGAVTITCSVGLLVFALSSLGLGFAAPRVWGSLLGTAAMLAASVLIELNTKKPLLSFTVFKARNVTVSMLLNLMYNGISIAVLVVSLIYVQKIGHFSPASIGLLFIPAFVMSVTASRIVPLMLTKISGRTSASLACLSMALLVVPALFLSRIGGAHWMVFGLAALMVCLGTLSSSVGIITVLTEATGNAPSHQRGVVSAIMLTVAQLGAAIGVAASSATLAVHAAGAGENFTLTFLCAGIAGILGGTLSLGFFRFQPPRKGAVAHG